MASKDKLNKDDIESIWDKVVQATVLKIVAQDSDLAEHTWIEQGVRQRLDAVIKAKKANQWTYLTEQQWLDWYAQLFTVIIGVATLGAGFTFTVIFSDPPQPWRNSKQYVLGCIAASWMLFIITLGWCCLTALVVAVNRTLLLEQLREDKIGCADLLWWVIASVLVAELLPIGAFLASAKAVRRTAVSERPRNC